MLYHPVMYLAGMAYIIIHLGYRIGNLGLHGHISVSLAMSVDKSVQFPPKVDTCTSGYHSSMHTKTLKGQARTSGEKQQSDILCQKIKIIIVPILL